MIIEARDDVVTLSGSLDKNLWPSIESAASLLLRLHPSGILIDASGLTNITSEGARTFLDAIIYIERYSARIVLCRVPDAALEVIRNVPGVRSRVPIAQTCEQARTSLALATAARERAGRMGRRAAPADGAGASPRRVLVPLLRGCTNIGETVALAAQLGTIGDGYRDGRGRTRIKPRLAISYILEVPRTLPLNAPLSEEEEAARLLLNEARAALGEVGAWDEMDVARTRDAAEEIVERALLHRADMIVLSLPPRDPAEEAGGPLITSLLTHAPCEVVIKR